MEGSRVTLTHDLDPLTKHDRVDLALDLDGATLALVDVDSLFHLRFADHNVLVIVKKLLRDTQQISSVRLHFTRIHTSTETGLNEVKVIRTTVHLLPSSSLRGGFFGTTLALACGATGAWPAAVWCLSGFGLILGFPEATAAGTGP